MYNVSISAIESIAHGNSWKSINNLTVDDIRISRSFTNDEIYAICKFFEEHDINNKELYNSQNDIYRDCFRSLGLDKKYNLEQKRKTMSRLLYKSRHCFDRVTNNYNYEYIN